MYIERHAEKIIEKLSKMFGAVLVMGSKQVGKTTFLRKSVPSAKCVLLDDPILLISAQEEASTFFKNYNLPNYNRKILESPLFFTGIKT